MAKTRKSHPRFRREGEPPRIELTDDDVQILRCVYQHRFISSDDLFRLFDHRSPDKISRRLTLLWRNNFLDRPDSQIDYHRLGGGSSSYAHGLGNAGATLLKDKVGRQIGTGDWHTRNRRYTRESLDHTLAITRFLVDVEIACRQRGDVEYISFAEILKTAPVETQEAPVPGRWKVPLNWQGGRGAVMIEPDAIFGLRATAPDGKRKESFVFLEIDRGTMTVVPNERTRDSETFLHRTSVLRKFVCYAESYRQGRHKEQFGIPSARIITLTTSAGRVEAMRDAAREHVVQSMRMPPGLLVFAVQTEGDPFGIPMQNSAGVQTGLLPS